MALSQAEFNRMVSEHGPPMYRLACRLVGDRHEAEDIVQETFRSAWKSRKTFEAGRGERTWLATILHRRVVDRWRKGSLVGIDSGEQVERSTPAEDPLANDYTDEMQQALKGLSTELRETLLLVVVGELTHQAAADVLGVPIGTVLSRVSRARTRLRELLLAEAQGADN